MPDLTIIDLPSFKADPARHGGRSETIIACDFTRNIVLIGGTAYAVATVDSDAQMRAGPSTISDSTSIGSTGTVDIHRVR